jgi:hypothetical protein
MANTLTAITPQMYSAVDIISRELVGLIPGVSINGDASRAALNDSVDIPYSNPKTTSDIAPAMATPEPDDTITPQRQLTITRAKSTSFGFTGEETKLLNNGPGYMSRQTQEIVESMRVLTNSVEADIASLYTKFSRAFGTAGTTPFASTLTDSANILKILKDNGAPWQSGWTCGIDTVAGAKLLTLTQLTKVNESGDKSLLRQGTLLPLHNGYVKESAQILDHTKGTGAGYLVDLGAGYAVGTTTIHVDTGTGTILAGDVVTFAGDTNKYIVTTGFAGDGDGDIVIAAPGLRQTLADGVAMTIGDSYTANMSFTPNAIQLATRLPALPEGGDDGEHMIIVDPVSGLTYEFSLYKGYRKNRVEVALVWGYDVVKPEHTAILLG